MGEPGELRGKYVVAVLSDVHPRLEIRDVAANKKLATLFLRSLSEYMKRDHTQPNSYFQAAAIHGLPYEAFDGVDPLGWTPAVPGPGGEIKPKFGGYCHHSTQLFPPWHRPYLMLVEQELQAIAVKVAKDYKAVDGTPDKEFADLASQLRLPYWDWAWDAGRGRNTPLIPDIIVAEKWEVLDPRSIEGTPIMVEINNPLYCYEFARVLEPPLPPGTPNLPVQTPPISLVTLRHPKVKEGGSYASDNKSLQAAYSKGFDSLRRNLLLMLLEPATYQQFSNKGEQAPVESTFVAAGSLEGIHDTMHNILGGTTPAGQRGHIGIVPYSSFDPVFWLHHCNVDRVLALWEAVNQQAVMETLKELKHEKGTFANSGTDFKSGPDSDLFPFRQSIQGSREKFWTPRDVLAISLRPDADKITGSLGYYYPELGDNPSRDQLIQKLNALYKHPGDEKTFVFFHLHALSPGLLPGPFTVELSIKGNPERAEFKDQVIFAGSISTFDNTFTDSCRNCRDFKPQHIRGRIEMAAAMAAAGWDLGQIETASFSGEERLAFLGIDGEAPRNISVSLRGGGAAGQQVDLGPWGISVGRLPEASEAAATLEMIAGGGMPSTFAETTFAKVFSSLVVQA